MDGRSVCQGRDDGRVIKGKGGRKMRIKGVLMRKEDRKGVMKAKGRTKKGKEDVKECFRRE